MQEALGDSFPTSLTLSWGQSPLAPTTARAGDLPTPIHMQKNPKAEGLLDLISCCAFCKIRIIPSPSQKEKARVAGWGWGREETEQGPVGVRLNVRPPPALPEPSCHQARGWPAEPPDLPALGESSVGGVRAAGGVAGEPEPLHPQRGSGPRGPPRPRR